MTPFSLGLRARIAIALAVVLGAFIFVTEVSISQVLSLSLGSAAAQPLVRDALVNARRLVMFYLSLGASVTLAIGTWLLWRLAVQPLQRITRAVESVASGDLKVRAPAQGALELLELGAAFNRMAETLLRQREEIEQRIVQLERSRAELSMAQDRLIRAAKLASVGTLAAGVAHEIGNPLAGLLGLVAALEHEKDEDKTRRYRELMGAELRRIDTAISGLLAYARPSPESDEPHPSCAVEEVLEHVRTLLSTQKDFAQVRVEVTGDRELHPVAMSRDELTQLLVNLLLNSAQAMEGRGRIQISIEPTESAVRLSVADDGPGISEQDASNLFVPFFTTKLFGKGSGLGLAICHDICERCGGELSYDAGYGKGARFVATLPAPMLPPAEHPV
ncbi:MAG: ATP-binding protein [Myxococcota bacterium]|jgi:signal transduction histidine kinase|nr:ATP-binding protein [Myxococcota bacterium]